MVSVASAGPSLLTLTLELLNSAPYFQEYFQEAGAGSALVLFQGAPIWGFLILGYAMCGHDPGGHVGAGGVWSWQRGQGAGHYLAEVIVMLSRLGPSTASETSPFLPHLWPVFSFILTTI